MIHTMRKNGQTMWAGIILLLIGFLFLLGRLQLFPFTTAIHDLWPIILIVIGVLSLANRRSFLSFHGWLLILLGAGFLFATNHIYGITWDNLWQFWPIMLIFLGLSIIFGRESHQTRLSHHSCERSTEGELQERVVMGNLKKEIVSDDFRGGSVEVVLGQAELDLRAARIKGDGAALKVRAVMSHVELRVPADWRIEMEPNSVMGAVHNEVKAQAPENAKRLRVSAEAVMGTITIHL